jgi:FKBP-type peptidyl-prolyl cis-trans isomerase
MMKKTATILLSFALLFAIGGCSKGGGFKKTKSGLLYKIISDGKNPVAKKGEFLKVHYTQKIQDSVLSTSIGGLPTYAPVDSVGPVYNPAEIFALLRKGDSAVIVMLADSLSKKQGSLPPFIHKKDKLTLTLKVVDVLKNEDDLKKDQQALLDEKKVTEVKDIEKYLADKNIKAEKAEKGTFVEIIEKGNGPAVDTGKAVHVMYKGQTFGGKVFDSNLDTAFGHTDPFVFVIGQRGAIEGWDDGLRLFNKGGKGRLYIPSMLAYGANPPQGAPFKQFENLIFDIEVVDVTDAKNMPQRMPMQRPGR